MSLFNKTLLTSLNGKEIIAVKDPNTGKIFNIEASLLLGQIFNLDALGNSCLTYPINTVVDCSTGETIQQPLQIVDVLLEMERSICSIFSRLENCCSSENNQTFEEMVYNEFLGESLEWTVTEMTGGQNIDLDSVNNPYNGLKSIEFKESNPNIVNEISLVNDIDLNTSDLKEFKFFIDKTDSQANFQMKLAFMLGNTLVAEAVAITEGNFGFSNLNNGYNEVIVPLENLNFYGATFNKIVLITESVNSQVLDRVYFDYIRLLLNTNISSNILPIVNAGADASIQLPTNTISLNAIASDSDGTIETYLWQKISGGNCTITNPNSSSTTVTGLLEGTYVFRVTVVDNDGGVAVDTKVVTINASSALIPPVSNAGANQIIYEPTASTNLIGTGSTDSDGTIVSYEWNQISGSPVTISNSNTANITISGLNEPQDYVFELTVTDNDGLTNTDTVTVTLSAEQEVSQLIQIYAGDCGNPQFSIVQNVYISELPSVIASGLVNINDGDILYTDSGLTTPFDGGATTYIYRGIQPNQVPNEVLTVANNGVVSNHAVCNRIVDYAFNYNSNSQSQNDTIFTFTEAILTSGYTSGATIDKIRITELTSIGELAIQGNAFGSTPIEVTMILVNNNNFAFWADDTNGLGNNGNFVTTFNFVLVDDSGNDVDYVTIRLTATDIA